MNIEDVIEDAGKRIGADLVEYMRAIASKDAAETKAVKLLSREIVGLLEAAICAIMRDSGEFGSVPENRVLALVSVIARVAAPHSTRMALVTSCVPEQPIQEVKEACEFPNSKQIVRVRFRFFDRDSAIKHGCTFVITEDSFAYVPLHLGWNTRR